MLRFVASGDEREREIEILVLRHQIKVLGRKAGRPKLKRLDKVLLVAEARLLPAGRRFSFLVKPDYVLFFIEVGTRRVSVMSSTRNPDAAYTTQQARNLCMAEEPPTGVHHLIRDRDSKYTRSFDDVFDTEGARVILTPIRAPKANAYAERWVRTVRTEILDRTLVLSRRHLDRLLRRYTSHYNSHRPHRGIGLAPPDACGTDPPAPAGKEIRRREVLPGINEYLAA